MSITTPFSVAKWRFIIIGLGTIVGLLIAEPVAIIFGSSRRAILLHEAGVFVLRAFSIAVSRVLSVFPPIEFSVSAWFAIWLLGAEGATWAASIPVLLVPAPAVQAWFPIATLQVSLWGIFLFEESIAEIESIVLLVWLGCPRGSICQIEGSFTTDAR